MKDENQNFLEYAAYLYNAILISGDKKNPVLFILVPRVQRLYRPIVNLNQTMIESTADGK